MHGIVLRIAGMAFATLPEIEGATISGYTQRTDPATGREEDEYVISTRIGRAEIQALDFSRIEQVDPVDAVTRFELRRTIRAGRLERIEPFAPAGS